MAAAHFTSQSEAFSKKDRVARDFRYADKDRDGKLNRSEWNRRGNFEFLDRNSDDNLSLQEVRTLYKGHGNRGYDWPPKGMSKPIVEIDLSIIADRVGREILDFQTLCGISRFRICEVIHQRERGLIETGTGPRFPGNAHYASIDDYWAMDYSHKRKRRTYHGGIYIPVRWGTPMLAVAAGSVIAKYQAHHSKRGIELVLRHSPEQTGLSIWTYSSYGHLDIMPDLAIGQRVKMGQIIGPTGNSRISGRGGKRSGQSAYRRPAIHLAMFYSDVRTFSEANNTIIPVNGRWLDPMAFYRKQMPFDSMTIRKLPDTEKEVSIPVMFTDGKSFPADTKLIWPYACQRK